MNFCSIIYDIDISTADNKLKLDRYVEIEVILRFSNTGQSIYGNEQ